MKNKNTETEEMIKSQKAVLSKINKEKEQLLLCSNKEVIEFINQTK